MPASKSIHTHAETTASTACAVLQRACACGGSAGPTGECTECRRKRTLQPKLRVNHPGDRYEQEADRVAAAVMRMPDPVAGAAPLGIQRLATAGELRRQPEEEEEEEDVLKAKAEPAGPSHAGAEAPPVVHDVLRSPGRPLDGETQGFMEQRFGHDFSQVRIHAGAPASASARSIGARAYTVGRDVVFGTGEYAPGTDTGRKLLAHELTHVVQQRQASEGLQSRLAVSQPGDVAEREADMAANRVVGGLDVPALRARPSTATIHFQRDKDPGQPAPEPSEPAPGPVCGPDVTTQVEDAASNTKSTFAGWGTSDKESACQALISLSTGGFAWDIVDLHNNAWILGYRPACASAGATPPCGSTVQVGSECSYAGSPNYVIYGVMMKLCHSHYTAAGSTSDAADFTRAEMMDWINIYKGTGFTGLGTPSGNFGPSQDWAGAGFDGWPAVASPSGDRNGCSPPCPTPYAGSAFRVNWHPNGEF